MNDLEDGMVFCENQVYCSYNTPFDYEFGGLYASPSPLPNYGGEKWINDLVPLLCELKDQAFNLKTKMYEMARGC